MGPWNPGSTHQLRLVVFPQYETKVSNTIPGGWLGMGFQNHQLFLNFCAAKSPFPTSTPTRSASFLVSSTRHRPLRWDHDSRWRRHGSHRPLCSRKWTPCYSPLSRTDGMVGKGSCLFFSMKKLKNGKDGEKTTLFKQVFCLLKVEKWRRKYENMTNTHVCVSVKLFVRMKWCRCCLVG